MTRSAEITAAIRDVYPKRAALTATEISEVLGYERHAAGKLLKGLPYATLGRKKMYLVTDVSKRFAALEVHP